MADNIELNAGSGGAVIATDDDGTAHHQYVKLEFGADNTQTKVTSSVGLPVGDAGGSLTVDNAGTFAVQVDGNALTSLQLIDDGIATTGSAITTKGMAAAGTDGTNARILKTDASGELQVDVLTLPTLAAVTTVGTVTTVSTVTNMATIGTSVTPGTSAAHLGKAEDAAHASGDTGVMALGVRAASPTERSAGPTDGDYEPFATNEVGAVWTTPTASANGGLSIFRSLDIDESEEEIKASAGTVYGMWVTNTATSTRFIKFYNATAANVTVGTTTPVITIGIPGNTSDDVSGSFGPGGIGIGFATAISVAATTAAADADTGAPSAGDVIINVFYK